MKQIIFLISNIILFVLLRISSVLIIFSILGVGMWPKEYTWVEYCIYIPATLIQLSLIYFLGGKYDLKTWSVILSLLLISLQIYSSIVGP